MDRRYVIEHDIVARYVRGKLEQEESEAFEAFFLEDEATLEELELLSELWADGSRRSTDESLVEPLASPVTPILEARQEPAISAQVNNTRRWAVPFAAAASLAVGVLGGNFVAELAPKTAPSGSLALLDIATLRSSDVQEVLVPANANYAAFRVAIGAQEGTVDVALERNDESVARVEDLVTDGYGDVIFVVPAGQLTPGIYRVSAVGTESDAVVFETAIKLSRR